MQTGAVGAGASAPLSSSFTRQKSAANAQCRKPNVLHATALTLVACPSLPSTGSIPLRARKLGGRRVAVHASRRTTSQASGGSSSSSSHQDNGQAPAQANNPTEARRMAAFQSPPGAGSTGAGERAASGSLATTSGRSGSSGSNTGSIEQASAAQRRPRYTVHDKSLLSKEDAQDIAQRLRAPAVAGTDTDQGSSNSSHEFLQPLSQKRPLRVYRYGVDDLRLYKALDMAGLEGRVVVADSMAAADAVLAARSKRTGKRVDLGEARRAARSAGVPMFVLPAVSAVSVLKALGPLLGMDEVEVKARMAAGGGGAGNVVSQAGAELLRGADASTDGAEDLLALLHGGGPDGARAWLASRVQRMEDPLDWVLGEDVEDDRASMLVGRNRTELASTKYPLRRPLRHGSRLTKRKLLKDLAENSAPW